MRRAPIALLLAVALAVAGCGSGDDDGDGGEGGVSGDGVRMSASAGQARPGGTVELRISNETASRLEYGVAYELERKVDGGWEPVKLDMAFIQIARILEPGRSTAETIRLPRDLRPGTYRIIKRFTAISGEPPDTTAERLSASVEIRVA